jgi:RNA polymerase sigma-70 factor (ECF subfamily)
MDMGAMTQTAGRQEAGLLASAAAGDEIAFRRIIAAHHEDMRRVCLAISGDEAIADEAVEAAWVIAWKKLSKVRGPAQLRPWLVSVAVKEAKQLLRKRQRHARMEVTRDPADAPGGIDPATGIAGVDLRAALLRLGSDDRALLVMRYGAGFDSTELAAATGKTPAAIRQRLKRLTDRLREDLSDD